jgi:hypothetical protein
MEIIVNLEEHRSNCDRFKTYNFTTLPEGADKIMTPLRIIGTLAMALIQSLPIIRKEC